MKITFFSTQQYDKEFFTLHNAEHHYELEFLEVPLNALTAELTKGSDAVCVFVNDTVDKTVISKLVANGVKIIALRCAGFNNVDIEAAKKMNIHVCRVPAYSPQAVAEHAVAMILTLNRKTHKAYNRVREQNFALNGLLGFDLYGKTIGVIGTGHIGQCFSKIMLGFGCRVLAFDIIANKNLESAGVEYLPLVDLLPQCDIVSLHCPLNDQTRHLVNSDTIKLMKKGSMLINTSRGGLVDTTAIIAGLKNGQLAYVGIDVYEQEEKLFFRDLSGSVIKDDVIQRLMSFQNVLITAHQGFFTREALDQIAQTTFNSINQLTQSHVVKNSPSILV